MNPSNNWFNQRQQQQGTAWGGRYLGVRRRSWGRYSADIQDPFTKARLWLGTFDTAEEAALAYDRTARSLCGSSARTNFVYFDTPPGSSVTPILSSDEDTHRNHVLSSLFAPNSAFPQQPNPSDQPVECNPWGGFLGITDNHTWAASSGIHSQQYQAPATRDVHNVPHSHQLYDENVNNTELPPLPPAITSSTDYGMGHGFYENGFGNIEQSTGNGFESPCSYSGDHVHSPLLCTMPSASEMVPEGFDLGSSSSVRLQVLQQPNHRTGSTANAGSDQHQQLKAMYRTLQPECPRCTSTDTTFSFYANRKLSQPRYLCRTCKRHWTLDGALRDVPVGGRRRRNCSSNSRMSLGLPPLRFKSSLNNAARVLNFRDVNYSSTSASMGEGGQGSALNYGQVGSAINYGQVGSVLTGGGSGGATSSISFAPGLKQPQVPQTPQIPLSGGLETSPGNLNPFEGSDGAAGGPGYGAGGASILPMMSTSGVSTQLASATMEDNQQLNLAKQSMGMSEKYWNKNGGGSGSGTTSAWPLE